MPKFDYSVVVATYNRAAYIEGCLKPFMEPSAEGLDVVVVDDGSTDGSPSIVQRMARESRGAKIRLIEQSNSGAGSARNRGVAEVKTPFVAFLDDDDRWFPWTLQTVQRLVTAAPNAAMFLLCVASFTDETELQLLSETSLETVENSSFFEFYLDPPTPIYGSCNVVVRRDAFWAVGGFDSQLSAAEDIDLFFRMSAEGPTLTAVAPILVGYRVNTSGSLSKNSILQFAGTQIILGRYVRGELVDEPKMLQAAMTRFVLIRFWTLFSRGEIDLAWRLLKDTTLLLRREKGIFFVARLYFTLLRRKLFPKGVAIGPA